jgi:hypothetical protein
MANLVLVFAVTRYPYENVCDYSHALEEGMKTIQMTLDETWFWKWIGRRSERAIVASL